MGGQLINPVKNRENVAYVKQEETLMPTATPREALRFSAMLRLSPRSSGSGTGGTSSHHHKEEKEVVAVDEFSNRVNRRVEEMLAELGIADCADVMIGGGTIKGISGGQRKRASIGVELITDPQVWYGTWY